MKHDFIVIGAGMSGLSSAIILARNGFSVALLEKSDRMAPLLTGFTRKGVLFDTGFHYTGGLGPGEPLDLFFRYLGLAGRLESFPFDRDGFDLFRCPKAGFEFSFPEGYDHLRQRLVEAFPSEQTAIDRYLDAVRTTCDRMPYLNLDADPGRMDPLDTVHSPTLRETLDAITGNSMLKNLLSMHCLLYGTPPEEAPFTHHARIVGNYYLSTRGIRGGGAAIASACAGRLTELGVEVRYQAEVETLLMESDRFTGVRLKSGEELTATGCVATVHPSELLRMAPDRLFRPAFTRRLRSLQETVSAYLLFGVSSAPIPALHRRNLFIFPPCGFPPPLGSGGVEDNPLYVNGAYRDTEPGGFVAISPAPFAATAAWADSSPNSRPAEYVEFKDQVRSRLERHLESSCPELAGTTVYRECSTPLTLRDYTGSPAGGLYGVKHATGQVTPFPVTRVKGLYLAGQGVVTPGVLGAVLSGFIACGSMLGHDRLRKEIRECS